MTTIAIREGSTEKTVKKFKELFTQLKLASTDVLYAKIYYDVNELVSYEQEPLTFPLIIYTKEYAFCLADCNAGYGGTGPHGTVEVLHFINMVFDEEEIYQRRNNGVTDLFIYQ